MNLHLWQGIDQLYFHSLVKPRSPKTPSIRTLPHLSSNSTSKWYQNPQLGLQICPTRSVSSFHQDSYFNKLIADHNSYPNPLPNPPTPPPHNHLTPNPCPNPHYNPHPDPRNHLITIQKANPRMLSPIRQVINPVFLLRLPLHRALRPLLCLPHLLALIPFSTPQPLLLFPPHTPRRRSQSLATAALRPLVMGPNLLCP
jgi:hypothetical protein